MLGKGQNGMNISEFIGLIVTVFFLIFFYGMQFFERRHRARHPELYPDKEKNEDEALEELLDSLHIDKEAYKDLFPESQPLIKRPPAKSTTQGLPKSRRLTEETKFHFDVPIENYRQQTQVESVNVKPRFLEDLKVDSSNLLRVSEIDPYLSEDKSQRAYDLNIRFLPSKGKKLILDQIDLKDQFIIKEILGKPKALSNDLW